MRVCSLCAGVYHSSEAWVCLVLPSLAVLARSDAHKTTPDLRIFTGLGKKSILRGRDYAKQIYPLGMNAGTVAFQLV